MVADVTITFEMYYNVTAKLFYMLLYNILPFEKCKVNTRRGICALRSRNRIAGSGQQSRTSQVYMTFQTEEKDVF
jgi:hypothetical protein